MRILFAAYCVVNNENGDSLIGVYKRALRIGLEMVRRGHEVWMVCPGRERYHDDLSHEAESCIQFLDVPLDVLFCRSNKVKQGYYRMAFQKLRLDLVVVGEAPLAGNLLDSALCGLSLGIRLVVLDNAFSPWLSRISVLLHGSMFDGIVLTGPSYLQMHRPPKYYCGVPPYIEGSAAEAEALLDQSCFRPQRLITVLGYEKKAQGVATALLPTLVQHGCAAVFLTPDPQEARERVASLPQSVAKSILVLPPPSENLLFGLLQRSSLVIGKCGFMQISECLSLGTPFLGINYRGCFPLRLLPKRVRRFVHATDTIEIDRATVDAAVRLVQIPREEIRGNQNDKFGARAMVADFLEGLPAARRNRTGGFVHYHKYHTLHFITDISEQLYFGMKTAANSAAQLFRPTRQ
ncbi:MAG: hypothetical protein WBC78_14885 [Candidatus Sulfotelmatobacter sp.]